MKIQWTIEECIFYMEEHLWESLSVAELASLAGYNMKYFSRFFKRSQGIGPGEWMRRRRLEHAAAGLCIGKSVTEIAHLCGYETSAGFNKAFLKQYGLTPSQYVRQKRQPGKSQG